MYVKTREQKVKAKQETLRRKAARAEKYGASK